MPPEDPHQILSAKHVQRFMYDFFNEKLKVEKLSIQVSPAFEMALHNLKVPLELNQTRTMKEPKYSEMRELIREQAGGYVMSMIRANQDKLGLEPGVFDLAFEGFWDMYTLHYAITEISPKKMQTMMQTKIKLQVNEMTGVPEQPSRPQPNDDEGNPVEDLPGKEEQPAYDPILAVVRIRIAKKLPEPIEDDDGNMVEPEYNEDELEEMPIDDKCLAVTTHNEDGKNILCINQAAGRVYRQDLAKELSNHNEALRGIDLQEFSEHCEKDAEAFEEAFIKLFA